MRYILLAIFLVGCGSSIPVTGGETQWSVTLGAWETPTCQGTMALAPDGAPAQFEGQATLIGSWRCGDFGTTACADVRTDGRVFLDLETAPGFLNHVRGTLADQDAIAGDILVSDQLVPFAAYRQ